MTVALTLIAYQVVLLGIGYWARNRSTTDEGYFLGGRGLGPWVASLSYAAGSSSAWSILGVSGIAFTQGMGSIWLLPGTIAGHIVVWFVLAPWLQRESHEKGWLTLTDVLVDGLSARISRLSAQLAAVIVLISFSFYVAAQFQGAANTFTAVFDFQFIWALLLGAAIVVVYTLMGGFWAVSLTDALQAILMLAAAIILPGAALCEVGGFAALLEASDSSPYWRLDGGNSGWFAVGFFLGMIGIGFGPVGQPHLLTRIMAMAERREIRKARLIAIGWFVVVLGGMYLLGLCGHLLLKGTAPGAEEQIFFLLAEDLLPAVLTGILIAAVLSAIMSTADSQLLVAGSALHHDLTKGAQRGLRQKSSAANNARRAVALVAIAAVLLALFLPESIFSRVLFAWNALGAAFGPLVVARFLSWRMRSFAVPLAMLLGFGLTLFFYLRPDGPGDIWERVVPFVVAFGTLFLSKTPLQKTSEIESDEG